jgi:hypothetical protein
MSRIDLLRTNYRRICGLPWDRSVAGPQRVWMAMYDKEDERKLRLRLGTFEHAASEAGHGWAQFDLTGAFADWLCSPPYPEFSESYFESPSRLGAAPLAAFKKSVADTLSHVLQTVPAADNTVVAVIGVASLASRSCCRWSKATSGVGC